MAWPWYSSPAVLLPGKTKLGWFLLLFGLCLSCRAQRQGANCSEVIGGSLQANNSLCGNNAHCDMPEFSCLCNSGFFSPSGSNVDCRRVTEPDSRCVQYSQQCVFCGSNFEGPCMKCSNFLLEADSGVQCVTACAAGFHITVLTNTTISVRACDVAAPSTEALPQWAVILIIVLAVVVIIICVTVGTIFIATLLSKSSQGQFDVEDTHNKKDLRSKEAASNTNTLRTKRSNSFSYEIKSKEEEQGTHFTGHENPTFSDDSDEETQFMQKLDHLRSQAQVYLRMLNDMRRRLKELPPDAQAAKQYRNVMQDVTRLLYLLNKKPSAVQMPPDGLQLLNWSEQILQRYNTSQGKSSTGPRTTNRLSVLGEQDETHF